MKQKILLIGALALAVAWISGCGGEAPERTGQAATTQARPTSSVAHATTTSPAEGQPRRSKRDVHAPRSPVERWINETCKPIRAWIFGWFGVNANLPGTSMGETPMSVWRAYTREMPNVIANDAELLAHVEATPPPPVANGESILDELYEHVSQERQHHVTWESRWRRLPDRAILYRELNNETNPPYENTGVWGRVDRMRAWLVRWVRSGGIERPSRRLAIAARHVPACRWFFG